MNASHAPSRALRLVRLAALAGAAVVAGHASALSSGVGAYVGAGLGGGIAWPGHQWSNPALFTPGAPRGPGLPGIPDIPGSGGLREVDQGYADLDPSRVSMQWVGGQADLRTPTDFDRLYIGADGRYYRVSGALVAAFDRSSYVAGPDGVYPEVPAGTVFYTGGLPPEALGEPQTREYPRLDARVGGPVRTGIGGRADSAPDTRAGSWGMGYRSGSDIAPVQPKEPEPGEPTLVTDEAYRSSRLDLLLRNASARRD